MISSTRNIYCYSLCLYCCWYIHNKYNFITLSHWSISNFFKILAILRNTCASIPTRISFTLTVIFTFTLTCFIISFFIWITCFSIEFAFKMTWNMFCHFFRFTFICCHIKCFNIYVFSFGTHVFEDKILQLRVRLFKLIIYGWYLISARFVSKRVVFTIHGS